MSFFLSFSLSLWLIPWSTETRLAHSPSRASKTLSRRCPVPSPHLKRTPGAFVRDASPVSRTLLVFCVNQGVSASFSLSLSCRHLRTARSWSIKGPQQPAQNNMQLCIFQRIRKFLFCDLSYQLRPKLEFEQTSGDSEGQGSLVCCSPWGLQRIRHDLATRQNNNKTQILFKSRRLITWLIVNSTLWVKISIFFCEMNCHNLSVNFLLCQFALFMRKLPQTSYPYS